MSERPSNGTGSSQRRVSHWVRPLLWLTPRAERGELQADLADEFDQRARRRGPAAARRWLAAQVLRSLPAALGRSVWRGRTGFEPAASRYRPGGFALESLLIDLRFALRHVRRRPVFTTAAALTLTLGIAGTGAVGSLLLQYLRSPLPVADEESLVQLWSPFDWSEAEHVHLRPDYAGFTGVAAYSKGTMTLRRGDTPARSLYAVTASAELFDTLGVTAALGETFRPGDDELAAAPVAVLSHRLFTALGASRELIGSELVLDGNPVTVRGVMPRGFWFPDPRTEVWAASPLDPSDRSGNYALVGRMKPGVELGALAAPLAQVAERLAQNFEYPPEWDKTKNPGAVPLRAALIGEAGPTLFATQGAMCALLLVAVANVATMFLGQLGARREDLAVRTALGAPRTRLVTQLVFESLVIGLIAGGLGAVLSVFGLRFLLSTVPLGALAETASVDVRLIGLALGLGVFSALCVALVPALDLASANLRAIGRRGRSAVGMRGGRVEGALVVTEVALAVLLAAGAGLLLRSVDQLRGIELGLDPRGVAVVEITAPADLSHQERRAMLYDLQRDFESLPGVENVAAVQRLPLDGGGWSTGLMLEGRPGAEEGSTFFRMVTPSYFATMGIEVLRGRGLESADAGNEPARVVVNQALVDRFFAGRDPLGAKISHGMRGGEWTEVVGVVENEAVAGLTEVALPTRYLLYDDVGFTPQSHALLLSVERDRDPAVALLGARAVIERRAPGVAIERTTTMEQVLYDSMGTVPQLMQLLGLLGSLALLLGAVGVYGVIHHFAQARTQEWSLRQALGLRPAQVSWLVMRRGLSLVAVGLLLGVGAAVLGSRLLVTFLYGVERHDPVSLLAASGLLLISAGLALLLPAIRAGRMQPAALLRL